MRGKINCVLWKILHCVEAVIFGFWLLLVELAGDPQKDAEEQEYSFSSASGEERVGVVIAARDEEACLPATLESLEKQTFKPSEVVVVDDGSRDGTAKAACAFNCKVISLPWHSESYVGRPELAVRFNVGLSALSPTDYVLILGGDSVLPSDYVGKLMQRFHMNSRLRVASGRIIGEPYDAFQPRGSGRLVDANWWGRVGKLQFPVAYGWEAWLQYKAQSQGFQTRCFSDLPFTVLRRSGQSPKQAECFGVAMRCLGYNWVYAVGRCVVNGPWLGVRMFRGWVRGGCLGKLDVADYVGLSQRRMLASKVSKVLVHGGRRHHP